MKYKLAIFDLDGTLLDTLGDLCDSVNYALTSVGFPERTLDEVRHFVGNGIRRLIERSVPEGSDKASVDRAFEIFKAYYKDHSALKTAPYEGIPSLLNELRALGVKLAVVSNKADFAVQSLCSHYFGEVFDYAVGERAGIRRKPAPDSVNEVLAELGTAREDAVYIGDSEVDIETAKNADMDCIAVDWGFREREKLLSAGGKQIASNVSELKKMLL